MSVSKRPVAAAVLIVLLLGAVVGLQAARERLQPRALSTGVTGNLLYVRSPEFMARAALSYRSLLADVYWIRTLQHYGSTKQSSEPQKQYDLLFSLLDLTTSLDQKFNIAYRFGAIFLTEKPPGGPGRPDQAIALLQKGLAAQPRRWEYALDIGFVHYRQGNYVVAADWFDRAWQIPGAPIWMRPLVAVTRTKGGDRGTSRRLWQEIVTGAGVEQEWLRTQGSFRLRQLDALDQIDAIERMVRQYEQRTGALPASWRDLVRARYLPGVPVDPDGFPYQLNLSWGNVSLDPVSSLNPLPTLEKPLR